MIFFVKGFEGYGELTNDLICIDEDGRHHRIDLTVSASFDDDVEAKDLIGKYVEVEDLQPYISIGNGVKIITQPNGEQND